MGCSPWGRSQIRLSTYTHAHTASQRLSFRPVRMCVAQCVMEFKWTQHHAVCRVVTWCILNQLIEHLSVHQLMEVCVVVFRGGRRRATAPARGWFISPHLWTLRLLPKDHAGKNHVSTCPIVFSLEEHPN